MALFHGVDDFGESNLYRIAHWRPVYRLVQLKHRCKTVKIYVKQRILETSGDSAVAEGPRDTVLVKVILSRVTVDNDSIDI